MNSKIKNVIELVLNTINKVTVSCLLWENFKEFENMDEVRQKNVEALLGCVVALEKLLVEEEVNHGDTDG